MLPNNNRKKTIPHKTVISKKTSSTYRMLLIKRRKKKKKKWKSEKGKDKATDKRSAYWTKRLCRPLCSNDWHFVYLGRHHGIPTTGKLQTGTFPRLRLDLGQLRAQCGSSPQKIHFLRSRRWRTMKIRSG